jgi:hypothetical protein
MLREAKHSRSRRTPQYVPIGKTDARHSHHGGWHHPLSLPTKRVPHPPAFFAKDGTRNPQQVASTSYSADFHTSVKSSLGCWIEGALGTGCQA